MPMNDQALDDLLTTARPEPKRSMQVDLESVLSGVEADSTMRRRRFGQTLSRRAPRQRRTTLGTSAAAVAAVVLAAGGLYAVTGHSFPGFTSGGIGAGQPYSPEPLAQNYAVSFSIDHGPPLLSDPAPFVQTQFKVNVANWSSNYDGGSYAVYMMVVDKTTPVVDLETSNSQNFAYPGWLAPSVMRKALQQLGLQTLSESSFYPLGDTMVTVTNADSATSVFDVRTKQPVRPKDWRLVIMAIGNHRAKTQVLWTKQVSPS